MQKEIPFFVFGFFSISTTFRFNFDSTTFLSDFSFLSDFLSFLSDLLSDFFSDFDDCLAKVGLDDNSALNELKRLVIEFDESIGFGN